MSWLVIEDRSAGWRESEVCVSFTRRGGAQKSRLPVLRVTFRKAFRELVGWKPADRVGLAIGAEENAGKLRIIRNAEHSIGAMSHGGKSGTMFVGFGHIAELGTAERLKFDCRATLIDADTIEVVLGEWPAVEDAKTVAAATRAPESANAPRLNGSRPHVDLTVDEEGIEFRGKATELTARPAALAAALVAAMPQPVSRQFLCQKIWGAKNPTSSEALLTKAITELRRGVATIGLEVESLKGVGVVMREAA